MTVETHATCSASPAMRTASAGVKTGAVDPATALSLDAFFDLLAAATLLKKHWLVSRTDQELSSWA